LKGNLVSIGHLDFAGDIPETHIKPIPGHYSE
jgi:hypothetical protein